MATGYANTAALISFSVQQNADGMLNLLLTDKAALNAPHVSLRHQRSEHGQRLLGLPCGNDPVRSRIPCKQGPCRVSNHHVHF